MAQLIQIGGHPKTTGATLRTDLWWVGPAATFLGLMAFIAYATFRIFEAKYYWADPYLAPFFSPVLFTNTAMPGHAPIEHAWFGTWPTWWPDFVLLPASPALLILLAPLSFRLTCYYYRKAYYRSFAWTPPACAVVGIRQGKYRGETHLLLFQNIHRYALYLAIGVWSILTYDAVLAFFRGGKFGVGMGTVILVANSLLIGLYTFGCHSFRHLIGGRMNCYSADAGAHMQHAVWTGCSALNRRHMLLAWASLFSVGLADLYVRLVSMGLIKDLNTWS